MDYPDGELQLLAPDFIYPEVSNVLWKKVHRRLLTTDEVWRAFEIFAGLKFGVTPSVELMAEAMQIALEYDHSPDDCFYVALSNREGCPLVTADEKLFRKVAAAFPPVTLLGAIR